MKKRFLAVFLALALCLGLVPPAFAASSDFVIRNGVLTYYIGSGGAVVIPNGVTGIGEYAFQDCTSLTSVTIPNSVTSIGKGAFLGCTSLTSVTIPNSVTSIGEWAFQDCASLTSVTIPNSVTSIEEAVFLCCTSLTSVTIPDSVTSIEERAFADCTSLTAIQVDANNQSYCSEDGVLFSADKKTLVLFPCGRGGTYSIPTGVTSIGDSAFLNCSLTGVTIPDSMTSSGDYAFRDCASLTAVQVDANNQSYCSEDGVLFSADKKTLVHFPCGRGGTYSIPTGVTSIGSYVFRGCSLTDVTIPSGVTNIGHGAFSHCESLTSVTIPASVTEIGQYAFYNCPSLTNVTSVTIPSSVTYIGMYAFSQTPWLKNQGKFPVANGTLVLYRGDNSGSVTIPDGITGIGEFAFGHYANLTSVTIPSGVTSIGQGAFYSCRNLTSVTIPDSVTSIGLQVFYGCGNLTSVTIPNGMTSIGEGAFFNCGLTSVTIPDSVTGIEKGAFHSCYNLASVTIPDSVTSIEQSAFGRCTSLTDIYYGGTEAQWKAINIDYSEDGNEVLKTAAIHYNASPALFKFPDLKPTGFYLDAVEWAVSQGVTTGKTATTFAPDLKCSHSEILTFLWRAAGSPESSAQPPIALKGNEFYYKAVKWAAEKGMIGADFNHKTPCTRADAVNYIWQAFGKTATSYDGRFTDVPRNSPYATAVAWALSNGITTGTSATTFTPDKICSRGEIVTFLYRAYK